MLRSSFKGQTDINALVCISSSGDDEQTVTSVALLAGLKRQRSRGAYLDGRSCVGRNDDNPWTRVTIDAVEFRCKRTSAGLVEILRIHQQLDSKTKSVTSKLFNDLPHIEREELLFGI